MRSDPASQSPDEQVRDFIARLTREQRMLIVLKRELYDGSWEEMLADLNARLEGRPYVFRLAHRISDDMQRIEELRRFEQAAGIDLADFVDLDSPPGL